MKKIISPLEKLRKIEVRACHFEDAGREVEPSALREVFSEIPNVKWDAVGGLEKVKQTLKEVIEWPLKYMSTLEQVKLAMPKGILLYGAPGCGKTLLAKAVATELGVNFITRNLPLDRAINLERLAKASEKFTGADIELVCKKASLAAIRECLNKKSNKGSDNVIILPQHFEEALHEYHSCRIS